MLNFRLTQAGELAMLFLIIVLFFIFQLWRLRNYKRKLRIRIAKNDLKGRQLNQISIEKQHILHSNERLTKEIRHRILRNLEIISTLLNSQSAWLDDSEARETIDKTESRIKTMFFIHRLIFEFNGEEYVEISGFIKQIVPYLNRFLGNPGNIKFEFELQLFKLKLIKAEPLGLLINEVLSNCLKHAFHDQDEGLIEISLKRITEEKVQMIIKDSGGTKGSGLLGDEQTMGVNLIRGLADQLDASLIFYNSNGLAVVLEFESAD